MDNYCCQCSCKNIEFFVPKKPKEIARCYCTICQSLHKKKFISFSKYKKKDILIDFDLMVQIKSTNHAVRYKCSVCGDWICMIYNGSDNIWLVIDRFIFDCSDVTTYDIYDNF